MGDNLVVRVSEHYSLERNDFRSSRGRGCRALAGAHGKEISDDGIFADDREVGVVGLGRSRSRQRVHPPQEFGGDGSLALGRGVGVGVGLQDRTDDRSQVRRIRVVEGALLFEMAPKRRTQEACGRPHRACHHWSRLVQLRVRSAWRKDLARRLCSSKDL